MKTALGKFLTHCATPCCGGNVFLLRLETPRISQCSSGTVGWLMPLDAAGLSARGTRARRGLPYWTCTIVHRGLENAEEFT